MGLYVYLREQLFNSCLVKIYFGRIEVNKEAEDYWRKTTRQQLNQLQLKSQNAKRKK